MKKFLSLILIAVSALTFFAGCNSGQRIAATPEEEYARVQNIDGEGLIFNFDTLQKLQVSQSVEMMSDEIRLYNENKPISNTLLFQLDASNSEKVKSYAKVDRAINIFLANPPGTDKIFYDTLIYSYRDNTSQIGGYFASYTSYALKDPTAPDAYLRESIKLLPDEHLTAFEGKRNFGKYTLKAQVKEESSDDFLEWFLSFYRFVDYRTQSGVYPYFKPESIKDIKFEMKSSAVQLLELNVTFSAEGYENVAGKDLTFTASTKFAKSGFKVTEPDRNLIN